MSETARMWMEISFNLAYLIVIWGLVLVMVRQLRKVPTDQKPLAQLFIVAFGLLALGDTGHVGFRVVAFAIGDLYTTVSLLGAEVGLVGLGTLATAITVTLFYVVLLVSWQVRFDKPYGWFGGVLLLAAIARFLLLIPSGNDWSNPVPPQPWVTYRNLPFTVLGLGVAYLVLRDSWANKDRTFTWIGLMILTSFAFYAPVILFVQQYPLIGMLMIPKTLAYVAIAFIAYGRIFREKSLQQRTAQSLASPS